MTGPLRRAHPFTPLTVAVVLSLLAFVLPAPRGPVILASCAIALAVIEGIAPLLRPAAITALPFWVFAFLIHGVLRHQPLEAVALASRFTTVVVAFFTVIAVVRPSRLVDGLLERGLPFSFAYVFAATLQSVPRLRARAKEIVNAQRCRGLVVGGSPWRRIRTLAPLTLPLILSALSEVDSRSFALESRGAGHVVRRTPLHPPGDSIAQRVLRWTLLGLALFAIGWRVIR
jgi:energy-coupling factor transport system permease protein